MVSLGLVKIGSVKCADCAWLMRTSIPVDGDCSAYNYPYKSDIEAYEDAQHEENSGDSCQKSLHVDFCGAVWLKLPRHAKVKSGTMVDAQTKRKCPNYKKR